MHAVLHRIEWRSTGGLLKEETMKERKVFLKPAVMGLDLGDGSERAARGQSM